MTTCLTKPFEHPSKDSHFVLDSTCPGKAADLSSIVLYCICQPSSRSLEAVFLVYSKYLENAFLIDLVNSFPYLSFLTILISIL